MVILAMAVLGMHHLLFSVADATVHGAASHPVPAEARTNTGCCASPLPADEVESDSRGGTPAGEQHGGHDLLHLCLAIMVAIAGVALVLIALIWSSPARVRCGGLCPGVGERARPPPGPTLRRLAVLCVLRQ
nr:MULTISPECIES: DUF6153 family protein [Nocardia]